MSGLADSLISRLIAQRDLLREMTYRAAMLSGSATSPDESVGVEVDGRGAMTELWLSPDALELEPGALANLVVETAATAAWKAVDRQRALFAELNERIGAVQAIPLTRWDGATVEPL